MLPSFLHPPVVPARKVHGYHRQTGSVCPFSDLQCQASVPEHFPEAQIHPDSRQHPPELLRPLPLTDTICHPYTCQSCLSSPVKQPHHMLLLQICLPVSLKIHHQSYRSDHLQHGYMEGSSTDHAETERTENN